MATRYDQLVELETRSKACRKWPKFLSYAGAVEQIRRDKQEDTRKVAPCGDHFHIVPKTRFTR